MKLPILSFENISYKYSDGTLALKDITLSIHHGKKIALIGNNGAGKSTLFLLLNGIIKPTNGQILFKGKELSYTRQEIRQLRKQVGIVFQNPDSQLFSSSVYEDIKFGPKNLGLSPKRVKQTVQDAMTLTETESLKDRPPHFLSIGQKKRVSIAGIIAMNPELMVLDEPTAGLDPYYSKKIMNLLDHIHNENRTILLSTHNVDFAYEWADEVIVLNNGTIIAHGSPVEVFQNVETVQQSHLEQPWIMEVFNKLTDINAPLPKKYPKSKNELLEMIGSSFRNN
ncbi:MULTISPECIES: energy-coupling factor ABC transporter ATP-binding protein [Metabacillus]|uniref:ABC transporter ATP-binding protein n=1 Tax=Metabacillus rhizolycopersici TaxID=2875709 RepID=A0ABS7UNX2_9BACI|nr:MULTISPECIES: ATP-binding cassette domain-containing protein [Metabacillus]MBZ5749985.1 ATP-binding cassette domain-containing protein [Metabacillus rhizolycopersici]MCM3654555.1 ATP-binding cassette domain-containing protein [Metabacillus litoralis]